MHYFVLQKPMVSYQNQTELHYTCLNLYLNESFAALAMQRVNIQLVPVLLDPYCRTLFVTDFYSKRSIQLYDYGIRLIKKLAVKSN